MEKAWIRVVPCNGNVDWNFRHRKGSGEWRRRSLQWERGLKWLRRAVDYVQTLSFPAMGTWIEMLRKTNHMHWYSCRSLQWERGLKYGKPAAAMPYVVSFPAMGTWIEILLLNRESWIASVVPCNGNVDWNYFSFYKWLNLLCRSLQWERGLKFFSLFANMFRTVSFPAMGTWIEILLRLIFHEFMRRSLQWERGLKCKSKYASWWWRRSFPAMGTWIEICIQCAW